MFHFLQLWLVLEWFVALKFTLLGILTTGKWWRTVKPYWLPEHSEIILPYIKEGGDWSKGCFPDGRYYYEELSYLPRRIMFHTTFNHGSSGSPGVVIKDERPLGSKALFVFCLSVQITMCFWFFISVFSLQKSSLVKLKLDLHTI